MDFINIPSAFVVVVFSLLAFYFNYKNYRRIGTKFFQYIAIAFLSFFAWSTGHFFQLLLVEEQNLELVQTIAAFSNSLSWLFVGFLIASFEYAKRDPNRRMVEALFLVVGMGMIFYFEQSFFMVEWNGNAFLYIEGVPIAIVRVVLAFFGAIILIPVFIGIFRMFNKNPHRFEKVRQILVGLIASGIASIISFVGAQHTGGNPLLYLLAAATAGIFLGSMIWILDNHPTLFIASRHELVELIIVEKNTGLPLYSFSFEDEELPINPEIVSAFVTSAGYALQEAMSSKSHLEKFHFGESEAVISEGFFVYGIILTRSSSELLYSLLDILINEFEANYWFKVAEGIRPSEFSGFSAVVQKLFEFDLPNTLTSFD